MKKLWVVLLILVTFVVISGCGGGGGGSKDKNDLQTCALIVESITDTTGNALEDVTVKVIGSSTYEGKSDNSGKVTINSIPLGTYLVSYSLSGKAPIYTRLTLKGTTTVKNMILMTWAECKSGYLATFIDETKCNIMGTVVATDGVTPLADATVSVSPAPDKISYLDSSTTPPNISNTATKTDDSGTFFAKMSPGKYTFTVSDASHTFDSIEVTINEPCFFKNFTVTAK